MLYTYISMGNFTEVVTETETISSSALRALVMINNARISDLLLVDKLFQLLRDYPDTIESQEVTDVVIEIKNSRAEDKTELFKKLYAALESLSEKEISTETSAVNIYGEIFARIKELKMVEDMHVEEEELLNDSQRKYLDELSATVTLEIMTDLNRGLVKYRKFVTREKRMPEESEAEKLAIPLSLEKQDLIDYAITTYQEHE